MIRPHPPQGPVPVPMVTYGGTKAPGAGADGNGDADGQTLAKPSAGAHAGRRLKRPRLVSSSPRAVSPFSSNPGAELAEPGASPPMAALAAQARRSPLKRSTIP